MAKFGLGKGLGALIPEHQQYFDSSRNPADAGGIVSIIPLSRIKPNPDQPRKTFPEASIDELADSIRRHGLLQPILAEPSGTDEYIIVAGERRFRAAGRAGLTEIPVIIRSVTAEKRLQLSLIENIQREDLNPMEEAQAYHDLMEVTGYTQEQVAEVVGKSRSHVANTLRLLALPEGVRTHLIEGRLSAGHARAIATSPEADKLADKIVEWGLSVRQAEYIARAGIRDPKAPPPKLVRPAIQSKDPDTRALEMDLSEAVGLPVEIADKDGRGVLSIRYDTLEQLDELCRRLSR